MKLINTESKLEEFLCLKADITHTPIGGALELLPLCNMNCRMCYIKKTKEEMDKEGRLLTADEWIKIATQARDSGMLFMLLTGGEPLLYPEFKKLYIKLREMGFIITINTNGTMITEEIADMFAEHMPRRLNITLYGGSNETYANLCNSPNGFTQVIKGVKLLKERNIPMRFNCSLTPYNIDDLEKIVEISKTLDLHLELATYMFPPARRYKNATDIERFTPINAAKAYLKGKKLTHPGINMNTQAKLFMSKINPNITPAHESPKGFKCRAGKSGFWINWKGEMLPCGMMNEPKINILENSFIDAWQYNIQQVSQLSRCSDCENCSKKDVCQICPAACYTEAGSTSKKPQYLCDMTNQIIKEMQTYL